jgi:adenylyltransferase/sulfurtransferase
VNAESDTNGCGGDTTRYHRLLLLPGIGVLGPRRLLGSPAAVIGCGALGRVAGEVLVGGGVGRVTLIDRDIVEWTNLQRQTLYDEADAREGTPKAVAAAARLGRINSGTRIDSHVEDFNSGNAERLLGLDRESGSRIGALVDGTDNFEARYLINDIAVKHAVPYVYGGAVGTRGMQMTVLPGASACMRCVFPEVPAPGSAPTCDTAGVLASATGIIANVQAAEALKVLLGRTDLITPTLLEFDLWTNIRRRLDLSNARDAACVCCGARRFEFLGAVAGGAASLCGSQSVQVLPPAGTRIDLDALVTRLQAHGAASRTPHLLRAKLDAERMELTVFGDGRAFVKGTTDVARARAIYARFVGA